MEPGILTVETVTAGDTWRGRQGLTITIGGATPTSPLASIEMTYRRNARDTVVRDFLSTGNGRLIIQDAAIWEFDIGPTLLALERGKWDFGIRFFAENGDKFTLITGRQKVLPDLNRK